MVRTHTNGPGSPPPVSPATPPAPPAREPPAPPAGHPPVIDVRTLFAGSSELRLLHCGMEYRLRITKQGKLILTK